MNNTSENRKSILETGYTTNKDMNIKKIDAIYINDFRTLKDKDIPLASNITILSGKNGTMKSTIMGLIAHPFSSPTNAKDYYNKPLKTDLREIFKFSHKFDTRHYSYSLFLTSDKGEKISETININYLKSASRHRIVVSGRNQGQGNMNLNTSFLNFKRLYPLVDTEAQANNEIIFTEKEKRFISNAYEKIMQKTTFSNVEAIQDTKLKSTVAPSDSFYDFNSISSGEDNLGHIIMKLLAFEKHKTNTPNTSNGIICIDEFESGLHPVVQIKLFSFLLEWSKKNKVQIIISSHSLYLLSHVLEKHIKEDNDSVYLNMLGTANVNENDLKIIHNPSYNTAYKELTLKDFNNLDDIHKVDIICEDEIAKLLLQRIIKTQIINQKLNFITDLIPNERGNSYNALATLCKNGVKLLENAVVIFDPDVPESKLQTITAFDSYLKIPDVDELCIEKRIVLFILELDGSDAFFEKFKKEKDAFKSEFSEANISLLPAKIATENIKSIKKWSNKDAKFKQYVTYYVQVNRDYYDEFLQNFKEKINTILMKKALPIID